MKIYISWLILINIISFVAFGVDKYKAQKDRWRVPEAFLLELAALGGAPAAFLAMLVFHHKTRKRKFIFLVPLLAVVHIIVFLLMTN